MADTSLCREPLAVLDSAKAGGWPDASVIPRESKAEHQRVIKMQVGRTRLFFFALQLRAPMVENQHRENFPFAGIEGCLEVQATLRY